MPSDVPQFWFKCDLILLHASLVRPGANEAVAGGRSDTRRRAGKKREREEDFERETDGMSCEDSKRGNQKAEMGNFFI